MENSSRKKNKNRKTAKEAKHYWQSSVDYKGKTYQILLTDSEVERGLGRAKKNPEDIKSCPCGKKSKCSSLWCALFGIN